MLQVKAIWSSQADSEEIILSHSNYDIRVSVIAAVLCRDEALLILADSCISFHSSSQRHDFVTLAGHSWLNDAMINFYVELTVERAERDQSLPRIGCVLLPARAALAASSAADGSCTLNVEIASPTLAAHPDHQLTSTGA